MELGEMDNKRWWETHLQDEEVTEGRRLVYLDGSMTEEGKVGGGWYGKGWMGCSPQGNSHVGETATVWDGEIAGMAGAVEKFEKGERILLLANSKAAIAAVKKAGRSGKARTRDLTRLMGLIAKRKEEARKGALALGWVKSYIGIHGNEMADKMAKKGAEKGADILQVMEGGIQQKIKGWRKEEKGREAGGRIWKEKGSVLESKTNHNILTTPDQQRGPAIMEA